MSETYLRVAAAIAGVLVILSMAVPYVLERLPKLLAARPENTAADMHFVLELASRLQANGRVEAVKLCQQLLDEMLKPQVPK